MFLKCAVLSFMPTESVDGVMWNYVEKNASQQETLILVHGNSQSSEAFLRLIECPSFLRFHVIAVDLPGHGKSSPLSTYNLKTMARALADFINHLKLKNYSLVGHSLGGHVCLHALTKISPSSLILFGTPPLKKPYDPSAFMPHPAIQTLFETSPPHEKQAELTLASNLSEDEAKLWFKMFSETDPRFRTEIFASLINADFNDEWEAIKTYPGKTHFILLEQDLFINGNYIRKHASEGKEIIKSLNLSHYPQLENPLGLAGVLTSCFSEN